MFFILSRTAALLFVPSNLLLLLVLVGLALLLTRFRRAGKRLALTSLVLFLVIGFLPVSVALRHIPENRFPAWDPARGPPDRIVVLGGVINPFMMSQVRGEISLGANYLFPLLDLFNVPRTRVMLESRSHNTYENAHYSKALVKPKPGECWLLVTSAQHMPRAMGCFRRVGFPVEAYPVDWYSYPFWTLGLFDNFGRGLWVTDDVVREWEGLFVYWITGRTSSLFPGPRDK